MIDDAFSEDIINRESSQIERPTRVGNVFFPQNRNAMSFIDSSMFFLHLLKYKLPKLQYQKLDKIATTTTTTTTTIPAPTPRSCICVPFYLCDSNQTIINDGAGIIDFR